MAVLVIAMVVLDVTGADLDVQVVLDVGLHVVAVLAVLELVTAVRVVVLDAVQVVLEDVHHLAIILVRVNAVLTALEQLAD